MKMRPNELAQLIESMREEKNNEITELREAITHLSLRLSIAEDSIGSLTMRTQHLNLENFTST